MMYSARMQNVWPGAAPAPADEGGPAEFGDTMSRSGVPTPSDGSAGGPPSCLSAHPRRGIRNGPIGTGCWNQKLTVPERAVGDCHPRQTVWLRADEPRTCGSPPPYGLAGDSRVPVALHGFGGIRNGPYGTGCWNRKGFGSNARARPVGSNTRALHPSPDGGIAARERAAIDPHQGRTDEYTYRENGSGGTPGATARHNAECRDLPRHSGNVPEGIRHHASGKPMEGRKESRQDRAASHSESEVLRLFPLEDVNLGIETSGSDSCVTAVTRLTQRPLRPTDLHPHGSDVGMMGVPGFETFCERTVACDARGCRMTNIAPWSHSRLMIWTRMWKNVSSASGAAGRRRIEDWNRSG